MNHEILTKFQKSIFSILGICADDVFLFTEFQKYYLLWMCNLTFIWSFLTFLIALKQNAVVLGSNADISERMCYSYNRAVKAMIVTSFTTSIAFFSTANSSILPISTLGIWSGLLFIIQLLLVITVYPSAVIIWENFWKKKQWWRVFNTVNTEDLKNKSETKYRRIVIFL